MSPIEIIATVLTGAAWLAVALSDRRARRRRQHINRMAAGRRKAEALPRRHRVTYAPPVPLTADDDDEFAALVFAYRYVHIPEPAERSGQ